MNISKPFEKGFALGLKIGGQIATKICPQMRELPPADYAGQAANDYLRQQIGQAKGGLMVAKFGTYELKAFICFQGYESGLRKADVPNLVRNRYALFRNPDHALNRLCHNAGFFPHTRAAGERYARLVRGDLAAVDILSSYQREEAYLSTFSDFRPRARIDLDGFYAPFLWQKPWTSALAGKRVLVVHPFAESIRAQYERRAELFADSTVLPDFKELIVIKAVQSIAGNRADFPDWFAALESMKTEMSRHEFDIALIGCGAYGFHLAAHAKRMGKTGILLAGWTQMLFGIYGNRWLSDQPAFARFINSSWVRPTEAEKPKSSGSVEGGCYW